MGEEGRELTEAPPGGFMTVDNGRQRLVVMGKVLPAVSWREAVLGVLCFVLLVSLIGVAAALGAASKSEARPAESGDGPVCLSADCLDEAAFLQANLDTSRQPCESFYDYACGGFAAAQPPPDASVDQTFRAILAERNDDALRRALAARLTPDEATCEASALCKARTFFQSCRDSFGLTDKGGAPLAELLSRLLPGGFTAFGTFDEGKWSGAEGLEVAQAQAAAPAFFAVDVQPDRLSAGDARPTRNLVTIDFARNGQELNNYTAGADNVPLNAYRRLITQVLRELVSDAGLTPSSSDITATINDILHVEKELALIPLPWFPDTDVKSVAELAKAAPGIDWLSLLRRFFSASAIDERTEVMLTSVTYTLTLSNVFTDLTPRQQNSFIIWTIIKQFLQDLGWQYTHFYRQFAKVKLGSSGSVEELEDYCVRLGGEYVGEALDFLFLRSLRNASVHGVADVSQGLKDALAQQIAQYTFFNHTERTIAVAKLNATVDHFGFSQDGPLKDTAALDRRFSQLKISRGDHLGNMEALIGQRVRDLGARLAQAPSANDWPERIYSTAFRYAWREGVMYFPSGALQRPVFDPRLPFYLNLGSLGRFLGYETLKAIDVNVGGLYLPNGTQDFWWGTEAYKAWDEGPKACAQGLYEGRAWDAAEGVGDVNVSAALAAQRHLLQMGALRAAHALLLRREAAASPEERRPLPGLTSPSVRQAFFLAFGQTFCYARSQTTARDLAQRGYTPERLFLNTLMSQFQPFTETFHCPASSPLFFNASKHCQSY